MIIKKFWWKIVCVILLTYTIIAGFIVPSPALPILHESIRKDMRLALLKLVATFR